MRSEWTHTRLSKPADYGAFDRRLKCGDVGAVVRYYSCGPAYDVEFVLAEGRTLAVVTLSPDDIRPMGKGEILHVQELTTP